MAEIGLFEAIYTARAIRRIKPDPVPDEIITKVLDAAIRAPSGSNAQSWVFIVVKDAEKRKQLGALYQKTSSILVKLYEGAKPPPHMEQAKYERWFNSVLYLFDHMGEAPVLIVPCLKATVFPGAAGLPDDVKARMAGAARLAGSSIYPAVQNIILACRAFGLGTVLTTIHAVLRRRDAENPEFAGGRAVIRVDAGGLSKREAWTDQPQTSVRGRLPR